MKLTTKGRYAVMAMADLASYSGKKPISLSEISIRQNISLSYLEQLFYVINYTIFMRKRIEILYYIKNIQERLF